MRRTRPKALDEEQCFSLSLDGLKEIERQNPVLSGRRERVAEHSWHVALCVMLLHEASPGELDIGHAVQLALVHDLAELYVGDTFAFGNDIADQHDRERRAIDKLRSETSSPAVQRIISLWEEYEDQASPEARFVKAMDAYLPIALNHSNITLSSWRRHDVAASQVRDRVAKVRDSMGVLADQCEHWIDEAHDQGDLG
jgi:putative hydrolases of HD superfamily